MPTNMPGGKLISGMGGYTNIISPYNGNMTRLDLASWRISRKMKLFRKGHSGTLNAIATRIVAQDWSAQIKIWWDIGNEPEALLGSGWGCGIQFGMGSYAGQASYGATQQSFYLAPSAMLSSLDVDDSSEGNDDGIVMAQAVVVGNGLLFELPSQLSAYQQYVQILQNLGQFNGLNTFTVMQ
jgi:hypothetical protein